MKAVSLVLSVVLVLGLVTIGSNVYAGDVGWYLAGGVLAGLVTGAIISDMSRPRYRYYEPSYVRPVYPVRPVVYYSPAYRYNTYRNYSYATSPYTTATVYEHEIVHTW